MAFLDYETYPAAVPRFPGYSPFDQIPFQFSLDVISGPEELLRHFEFVHTDATCPDVPLIAALRRAMPSNGSIITWNQSFEKGINTKLGGRNAEDQMFLGDINDRIVDLMDVFSKQYYVHPDFRGRASIKSILPVLVPHLNYKSLEIQEGATATAKWNELVTAATPKAEAEQVAADLLTYCALDTRAMVEIWRVLNIVVDTDGHRPDGASA